MIHNLYKQRGETPLECLERFRVVNPGLKNTKMTYLGRLDPMADGVLLVASGEDTAQSKREEFFELDKDYDFVALFGFATDTYDCLGKIVKNEKVEALQEMDLIKLCQIYEGERDQKYPFYSSKMIATRRSDPPSPASRGGDGGEVVKKINIYELKFKGLEQLSHKELFGRLLMDIGKVKGDFRQTEILECWKDKLFKKETEYFIGKFSASVSSGTYIRSIVNDIGSSLGIGACALSITRTRVGNYLLEDSLKF